MLDVTILHTVYTIEPKNKVMKTSFSNRNLSGATMLETVIFRCGVHTWSRRGGYGGVL